MPLLLAELLVLFILAGLALWVIPQVVLDPLLAKWARLAVIVLVVFALCWLLLQLASGVTLAPVRVR